MAFKIRRGTNAERLTIIPAEGELIYTTDTKKLYIGDGTSIGGILSQSAAIPLNIDGGQADTIYTSISALDAGNA